ncbi:MAG: hypothetical protein HeimC3_01140 [Candidatus Heimdallarchaeota archaeon LC_3]|nr:MAG: hypothetical protein HeimC3_48960 [Candidatus Heimdallarchaeota archaeon LC_3]OLS27951.1 MAG: hypothetical protein HeimC3_01140 [Candidatus Heimdallarchaeota archaeon LC_3]
MIELNLSLTDSFPFHSIQSRYNKFSETYLVKLDNILSIELNPFLTTSLYTYHIHNDIDETIITLKSLDSSWDSPEDDYSYKSWITRLYLDVEQEKVTPIWEDTPGRIMKIMDFSRFDKVLKLFVPFRHLILIGSLVFLIGFWTSSGQSIITVLLTNRSVLYTDIILILPIFYFSRFFFTPIHEFGHNFWYYMYRKQSGIFFINIRGLIRFQGITDLPDLLFLPKLYQRMVVSLGGLWAELISLTMILVMFPDIQLSFFVLVISLRVFFSLIWNMNLLSTGSDGHRLITDIIGFPTLGEALNEYLARKLANIPLKDTLYNRRVLITVRLFMIFSFMFVGVLIILQINYFGKLFFSLLSTSLNIVANNIFIIIMLLISYLYFLDFVVFAYRRIRFFSQFFSIRRRKKSYLEIT